MTGNDLPALTPADVLALERANAAESFSEFVQLAWATIDPTPYVHGWHMDAICEHLQAVSEGEISRLLINVPPGCSKSMLTSVLYPAWLWGPGCQPAHRFIGASYETGLATRDSRKTRDLVTSDWYRTRWPITFPVTQEQYLETEKRGFRQAVAVASMTGKRGDTIVWDDPLSPELANSEAERERAVRIFRETLPTRLNDPRHSSIIVIMQRLHEGDVSGHILEHDPNYVHLCLPMEFEPERRCRTPIGFTDPRQTDGELLCEARFPQFVVDRDKRAMGAFAIAGQYQQRPAPREGGLFQRSWFPVIPAAPVGCRWVRGWDLAATAKATAAFTAGVLIGRTPEGRFVIADAVRAQATPADVRRLMLATAGQDEARYGRVRQDIPQDPGQAGKDQAQGLVALLAGFDAHASPESGDKVTRAEPLAAQAEAGNVSLVAGTWIPAFLEEAELFPMGKFKDQIDAASRAFNEVARPRRASAAAASGRYGA